MTSSKANFEKYANCGYKSRMSKFIQSAIDVTQSDEFARAYTAQALRNDSHTATQIANRSSAMTPFE